MDEGIFQRMEEEFVQETALKLFLKLDSQLSRNSPGEGVNTMTYMAKAN